MTGETLLSSLCRGGNQSRWREEVVHVCLSLVEGTEHAVLPAWSASAIWVPSLAGQASLCPRKTIHGALRDCGCSLPWALCGTKMAWSLLSLPARSGEAEAPHPAHNTCLSKGCLASNHDGQSPTPLLPEMTSAALCCSGVN